MIINIKRVISAVLSSALLISLSGCGEPTVTPEQQAEIEAQAQAQALATREIQLNDYRGGMKRTMFLEQSVLQVVEDMKTNNDVVRSNRPNTFWTADGYQNFVTNFFDEPIQQATEYFNEEEADWNTTLGEMVKFPSIFVQQGGEDGNTFIGTIERIEKDEYKVSNIPCTLNLRYIDSNNSEKVYSTNAPATYTILYDCDKDRCKAYATSNISGVGLPDTTVDLFEYQRINNDLFAIQTKKERLLVELEPADADVDIRQRNIKSFYYSKLLNNSVRTTFEPYEFLPEIDANGEEISANKSKNDTFRDRPIFNENGNSALWYGEEDSMFFNATSDINENWVFEDKSLSQAICYKEGVLMVTTYNKITTEYERFVFVRDGSDEKNIDFFEELVQIKNLVGIVEVEVVSQLPNQLADENTDNALETDENTDNVEEIEESAEQND